MITIKEAAKMAGCTYAVMYNRIHSRGKTFDEAIAMGKKATLKPNVLFEKAFRENGCSYARMYCRTKYQGKTIEEATAMGKNVFLKKKKPTDEAAKKIIVEKPVEGIVSAVYK